MEQATNHMKKIILTAFFSLAFLMSEAQYSETRTAGFGIKGGANFTNLITNDINDNHILTSFNAGVFALLPLGNLIAIQPELNFSRKGAELVYDNIFAEGTAAFKLDYLEVPLLVKVNPIRNFNVHAGPYVAYLLNAKVENKSTNGTFDFENNFDNKDFNKLDYGVSGGIGFDFSSIGIGARYNYGLAKIGKERTIGGVSYIFPDSKNSALSIYGSVKF